jgi:peptide/nickel transport system ATP-binding protein
MNRLLTVDAVTMTLDDRTLLDDVSLHVDEGETVALVGESGSGKSLTSRLALGLRPDGSHVDGSVVLAGIDMLAAPAAEVRAQRASAASMVFQDPRSGINPVRHVGAFVGEALRARGMAADEAEARSRELLVAMGLPDGAMSRFPHEFSGGMLQRIMIAGALSTKPRLLLCDEPTTALDVTTQADIVRLLARLQRERDMGMLFVTHDLNLAAELADRVHVMRSGRIVEHGRIGEVFSSPRDAYTKQLLAATPSLDGPVLPEAPAADTAVRVDGVSRTYRTASGPVVALDDVSFTVRRGQALGVVGESGSGKSTIARLLVGLEKPDAGELAVAGVDPGARGRSARLARARAVQIVFQDPYLSLDPRITVRRAIADTLVLHGRADRAGTDERVRALLGDVGLPPEVADALPRALSGGQRQRVAIAKALAVEPDLLVLDEATSALDVSVQAQLLTLLARIREVRGLTMVFVSHNLAVMRETCDTLLVMRRGRIVEAGPTADVLRHPQVDYTKDLIAAVPRDHTEGRGSGDA